MPSWLPGMDPFLEDPKHWATFHRHLIAAMYQLLLPGLVDRYRARVSSRTYTSELVLFTSVTKQTHEEEYIEIRSRIDGRLVTLLEFVGISNRTTSQGRAAYLATRQSALAQRAGIVEIDLVTQGKPPLDVDRSPLPTHDYSIALTRGSNPDRHEMYTCVVRKRLPKFKVPLAADDRDCVHDLQVAFERAYDLGQFDLHIDYAKPIPPDVKLQAADADWVLEQVRPNPKT